MPTLSTVLLSVSAFAIQVRLLYRNGNRNENRSFYHDGNKKNPITGQENISLFISYQFALRRPDVLIVGLVAEPVRHTVHAPGGV